MARWRATVTMEGGGDLVEIEADVTATDGHAAFDASIEALEDEARAAGFEPGTGERARTATRIAFEIRKLT